MYVRYKKFLSSARVTYFSLTASVIVYSRVSVRVQYEVYL